MKRTYYNAAVTLKEQVNGIFKYRYEGYKKIRYVMKGEQVKVYLHSGDRTVETVEFNNVSSVNVTKYRK